MTERFDPRQVFDEDYMHFYETMLTPERDDSEAEMCARLLGLPPGAEVLDVPCGHGRIANRLAGRGYRVTGLDSSELFLERARADAASRGVAVEYASGDMRVLPWEARFDGVVNWFTSFGYFDDETDRAVLAGFRRALRPGGRLVIEHLNRERMLRSLPAASEPPRVFLLERGDDLMIDRVAYDAHAGCTATERIVVRGGRVRRTGFRVRVFTVTELRDWLLASGFARVDAYGADGEPFSIDARRLIVVAQA